MGTEVRLARPHNTVVYGEKPCFDVLVLAGKIVKLTGAKHQILVKSTSSPHAFASMSDKDIKRQCLY